MELKKQQRRDYQVLSMGYAQAKNVSYSALSSDLQAIHESTLPKSYISIPHFQASLGNNSIIVMHFDPPGQKQVLHQLDDCYDGTCLWKFK